MENETRGCDRWWKETSDSADWTRPQQSLAEFMITPSPITCSQRRFCCLMPSFMLTMACSGIDTWYVSEVLLNERPIDDASLALVQVLAFAGIGMV